ncbi:hypothetical protein N9F34_02900 [Alphaproteobacteria bacterium]|nr:hypothetical protein [Alphaproteobacteria bacterium]
MMWHGSLCFAVAIVVGPTKAQMGLGEGKINSNRVTHCAIDFTGRGYTARERLMRVAQPSLMYGGWTVWLVSH